jgi:hypothetical protein
VPAGQLPAGDRPNFFPDRRVARCCHPSPAHPAQADKRLTSPPPGADGSAATLAAGKVARELVSRAARIALPATVVLWVGMAVWLRSASSCFARPPSMCALYGTRFARHGGATPALRQKRSARWVDLRRSVLGFTGACASWDWQRPERRGHRRAALLERPPAEPFHRSRSMARAQASDGKEAKVVVVVARMQLNDGFRPVSGSPGLVTRLVPRRNVADRAAGAAIGCSEVVRRDRRHGPGGTSGTAGFGAGGSDAACAVARCGGSCVDTVIDVANCGFCGNLCPADTTCQLGACEPRPGSFGGYCKNDADCSSTVCLGGQCSKPCPPRHCPRIGWSCEIKGGPLACECSPSGTS